MYCPPKEKRSAGEGWIFCVKSILTLARLLILMFYGPRSCLSSFSTRQYFNVCSYFCIIVFPQLNAQNISESNNLQWIPTFLRCIPLSCKVVIMSFILVCFLNDWSTATCVKRPLSFFPLFFGKRPIIIMIQYSCQISLSCFKDMRPFT